tara:strand:- start:4358 stop:4978 length:621 start_codon:yes stop_codon:yes gene_type:complete
MNDFLLKEDFLTELNYLRFFIGVILTLFMVYFIKNNYLKNSFSNDNKKQFSEVLLPFALAMLLIVSVIKTSLALSLGLVGALSIIRFRTAIKESQQIVTLLIVLAISISVAAEKEILGIIVTAIYIAINRKKSFIQNDTKKLLIISFKSNNDIMIKDIEILQINRFYKTLDGMYTIEYFISDNENLDEIIGNIKKKLNVDFEYEIN